MIRPSWGGKSATGPARPKRPAVLPRVAREIGPAWPRVFVVLGIDLLWTPLLLLTPVPLKIAIDSVIGHKPLPGFIRAITPHWFGESSGRILVLAVVLQVLVVVLTEAQYLASYVLTTRAGEQITLAFRTRLFRHIQRLSILRHDARGTSDALYRVQYDAPSLRYITTDGAIPFVAALVSLITTVAIIAGLDWELALVAMGVAPPMFVLCRNYDRRMRQQYVDVHGSESDAMQVVQESLSALRVVKVFGREGRQEERFLDRSREGMNARVHLALAEGLFGLAVNTVTAVGGGLVLYIGVHSVQTGQISIGQLTMVIYYLTQLYAPLKTISRQVASLQSHLANAERAFDVLDELPEVPEDDDPVPLGRARGGVEFRRVSFGYDERRDVLRSVSLTVPPGATVGIAGRTGAGKTTLVGLLTRFFDPDAGSILLDGVDLRRYKLSDLRNQFAVVTQDPVLFSASISENIAYANPDATRAEIVTAAKAADADDFIGRLPDGYDTVVGERGMRLSGGERQRIALARAFLKNAPMLLLDEPTSSVDSRTEAAITRSMQRLMAGRTTFLISHRPALLEGCDVRLDVKGGRVVRSETEAARPERPRAAHRRPAPAHPEGQRRSGSA